MAGQPGLFDLDERYAALSRTGDPLERLAAVVDFEIFRAETGCQNPCSQSKAEQVDASNYLAKSAL